MKKLIIIAGIIVIFVIGALIYFKESNKATTQKDLSSRAKEFLKTQQSKGNLEFGGVNSSGKTAVVNSSESVDVGDCFSISIPFEIQDNKNLGKCFDQITLSDRAGMVNVYSRDVSYASLDDDSGVKMRRGDTKTYKEDKKVIDGKTYIIFQNTSAGYEKSALYLSGGKLFSLNLVSSSGGDELDKKFLEMLESVRFK